MRRAATQCYQFRLRRFGIHAAPVALVLTTHRFDVFQTVCHYVPTLIDVERRLSGHSLRPKNVFH